MPIIRVLDEMQGEDNDLYNSAPCTGAYAILNDSETAVLFIIHDLRTGKEADVRSLMELKGLLP